MTMLRELIVEGNTLTADGTHIRCAIGKSGVTNDKHEGDGATPKGSFLLRELWYRPDRVQVSNDLALPTRPITHDDGWCDAPSHFFYNRHVTLPFAASHEALWRTDHRYDLIIPLGYNDDPVIMGRGSAIFFHLAAPEWTPTEGCIAITREAMLALLPRLTPTTRMTIMD